MTLVKNVKFLEPMEATVVMTKADALRRRIFKQAERRNHAYIQPSLSGHSTSRAKTSVTVAKSVTRPHFKSI
jgi:hypothetical protein